MNEIYSKTLHPICFFFHSIKCLLTQVPSLNVSIISKNRQIHVMVQSMNTKQLHHCTSKYTQFACQVRLRPDNVETAFKVRENTDKLLLNTKQCYSKKSFLDSDNHIILLHNWDKNFGKGATKCSERCAVRQETTDTLTLSKWWNWISGRFPLNTF